jgi:hypothetical protein
MEGGGGGRRGMREGGEHRTAMRERWKPLFFMFNNNEFCYKVVRSASIQKMYVNSNNENDN